MDGDITGVMDEDSSSNPEPTTSCDDVLRRAGGILAVSLVTTNVLAPPSTIEFAKPSRFRYVGFRLDVLIADSRGA